MSLAYLFLFPLCFIDLHNYGDSGSMVFHSNFVMNRIVGGLSDGQSIEVIYRGVVTKSGRSRSRS